MTDFNLAVFLICYVNEIKYHLKDRNKLVFYKSIIMTTNHFYSSAALWCKNDYSTIRITLTKTRRIIKCVHLIAKIYIIVLLKITL